MNIRKILKRAGNSDEVDKKMDAADKHLDQALDNLEQYERRQKNGPGFSDDPSIGVDNDPWKDRY